MSGQLLFSFIKIECKICNSKTSTKLKQQYFIISGIITINILSVFLVKNAR